MVTFAAFRISNPMKHLIAAGLLCCTLSANAQTDASAVQYSSEKHFKNVRQLTFGGDNAEAYFGFDNSHITFQRTNAKDGIPCDRIYYGDIREKEWKKDGYRVVSTGKGRTTCAYLLPDRKHLLYATTHLTGGD